MYPPIYLPSTLPSQWLKAAGKLPFETGFSDNDNCGYGGGKTWFESLKVYILKLGRQCPLVFLCENVQSRRIYPFLVG